MPFVGMPFASFQKVGRKYTNSFSFDQLLTHFQGTPEIYFRTYFFTYLNFLGFRKSKQFRDRKKVRVAMPAESDGKTKSHFLGYFSGHFGEETPKVTFYQLLLEFLCVFRDLGVLGGHQDHKQVSETTKQIARTL